MQAVSLSLRHPHQTCRPERGQPRASAVEHE
jgi:hypothetical protein